MTEEPKNSDPAQAGQGTLGGGFVETAFTEDQVDAAIDQDEGDRDADDFLHPAGAGK